MSCHKIVDIHSGGAFCLKDVRVGIFTKPGVVRNGELYRIQKYFTWDDPELTDKINALEICTFLVGDNPYNPIEKAREEHPEIFEGEPPEYTGWTKYTHWTPILGY